MKRAPWLAVMLALALAACAQPQQPPVPSTAPSMARPDAARDAERRKLGLPEDGQAYPTGNTYRLLQVEELPIVGVSVDSQVSSFPKERLADGNLSTEWVNGGYRNPTSWAAVELAEAASLASIEIKTGPTAAGASYDVQVSADGASWTTVLSNQTNSTWGLEAKVLSADASGRFVRIFWRNSASNPVPHFSIFELVVNGEAGTTPVASPTPTPTPSTSPSATPTPTPSASPGGAVQPLSPSGVTASSTYSGLVPSRAIDGDLSTQWANGGYREPEAWLRLEYPQTVSFAGVSIKTGALPSGVRYRLEVSADGTNWTDASGDLTNTTWQMEAKRLSGTGRYLRVRFFNNPSNPMARFSIFEIAATGQVGATNRAPAIDGISQDKLRNPDTLRAEAHDPDGDALSYTWRRYDGSLLGTGSPVRYTYSGENVQASGNANDEPITLTVTDGRGGAASQTYLVDNMSGTTYQVPAAEPIGWAPDRAAYVPMSGTVTIQASGDFKVYGAVIVEYTTSTGRRMALAPSGTTTLTGVTGNLFAYLLGPSDDGAARPDITLQFSNGMQQATRNITVANVAGSHAQGEQLISSPGEPEHLAGESDARNGANSYGEALYIQSWGYLSYSDYGLTREEGEANGLTLDGNVSYRLIRYKDRFWAADHRLAYGNFGAWIGFTDSLGGAGDNTGSMTVYLPYSE